uniref:REKLES domain-containing protein n=1 Tax=Ditylenchus dipsaci TaxID=166011 RepID=A0A915EWT2_9BILA
MGPHSMAAALFGKHLNTFNLKDEVMDLNAINQQINAQHSQQLWQQHLDWRQHSIDNSSYSRKPRLMLNSTSSFDSDNFAPTAKKPRIELPNTASSQPIPDISAAAHLDHIDRLFKDSSSAHMKLTNTRAPSGEKSMVVSMEINGLMYQGVLFRD